MKNPGRKLAFFLMCVYAASYVTRVNFGAVVSEMVAASGTSKEALSYSLTAAFITYGAGQLLSGWLGDRFQPKYLLAGALAATSALNLTTGFLSDPVAMAAVWAANGLAQAFLWPPIVRILASTSDGEEYKKGVVTVSCGISVGTAAVYLVSPLLITVSGWRTVFFVCSAVGAAGALAVLKFCPRVDGAAVKNADGESGANTAKKGGWALVFSPVMTAVMAAIICQGALRDGVTTWMPSYIAETYSLGAATAILTGVLLPLFGFASIKAVGALYEKKLKDPFVCAGVIFGLGTVAAACLYFCTGRSPAGSVVFSAILTGAMHGVNLILVCMIPGFFSGTGKVAFVSGALNTCTYIGSAASTYLIPLIARSGEWRTTVAVWVAVAAVGCALTFIAKRISGRGIGG